MTKTNKPTRTHSATGRPLNVTVEWWFSAYNPDGWWARYHPECLAEAMDKIASRPQLDPWGHEDKRDMFHPRQSARAGFNGYD